MRRLFQTKRSHPWQTPPTTAKESKITTGDAGGVLKKKNTHSVVFSHTTKNSSRLKRTLHASLKAFQPHEEEFSLDRSTFRYSALFPSQRNVENATESTANTSMDAFSSTSHEINHSANYNNVAPTTTTRVQFDFDSGLGLNDDSIQSATTSPLHDIASHDEKSSIATDLEVQKVQSNRQQGRNQKRRYVEYKEENHNQYIARRFNRTRIEFYLDLLCPPDEILDEEVPTPPLPPSSSLSPPLSPVVSLPHLPNKGPETTNSNLSRSFSGENNSKQTKSFEGFSLDAAAELINSKAKKEAIKSNYNSVIRPNLKDKIPSSIDINYTADSDDEITLDESVIGSGQIINNNMTMIQHADTYDTTNSPTGVEQFDLAVAANQDPKLISRLKSPDGITLLNNDEARHYYRPMPRSPQRHNSERTIQSSKENLDHLRSKLDRLAKSSSSSPNTSAKSFASPVRYNSTNIVKIKSRMRQIESQYDQLRVSAVHSH